ncbi:SRPBCC family protein [Pontibacter pamirensis]|uniref:SRPBCC family protein n=1 Tax=Pontibacter pamirensis TaxID=2562824 RepID=UPI001389E485|nr:SRPBCC family protein [Pontibacter pamirensis]
MKLVTIVISSLLVLTAALAGALYQLPTQLEVQQSIVLDATSEEVYTYLDNPMEWEKWTILNKQTDPSMIYLYGGPMAGAGARMKWSGDKVGNGQVVFTGSTSPTSLLYLESDDADTSRLHGSFTLTAVEGGTKLVWRQQATYGENPWDRFSCLLRTYRKQDAAEKGLLGLRTLLLNNSKKKALK